MSDATACRRPSRGPSSPDTRGRRCCRRRSRPRRPGPCHGRHRPRPRPAPSAPLRSAQRRPVRRLVAEQVFEGPAAPLDPHEPEPQLGDRVPHEVVARVVGRATNLAAVDRLRSRPPRAWPEPRRRPRRARRGRPRALGEGGRAGPPDEPPGLDRDEEVAHPLDLAQEVRRQRRSRSRTPSPSPHEPQHVLAARRVESVRRLVEQQHRGSWTSA